MENKKEKKISFTYENRPNIDKLLHEDPKRAMEVVSTFFDLIEEACDTETGGIAWHDLPQLFTQGRIQFTFKDMVKGILHGALDCKYINPDGFDVYKEEVHPLSMLVHRPRALDSTDYIDWRNHYGFDGNAVMNQDTVAQIFRRLLRYYKYVNVEDLGRAMINKQIKTWEGLGSRNVENLPFMPALRYQQRLFGDLKVGKFYDEVGAFECGNWVDGDSEECPACHRPNIHVVGPYHICLACNGGFREVSL